MSKKGRPALAGLEERDPNSPDRKRDPGKSTSRTDVDDGVTGIEPAASEGRFHAMKCQFLGPESADEVRRGLPGGKLPQEVREPSRSLRGYIDAQSLADAEEIFADAAPIERCAGHGMRV